VVAASRARLELALLRPDAALAHIDGALATASPSVREELLALRQEAVVASHVLPWEGPSALASYRPAMPPPLTARRRLVPGSRPGGPRLTLVDRGSGSGASPRRLTIVPIGESSRDDV
jgi:hypothetical protein